MRSWKIAVSKIIDSKRPRVFLSESEKERKKRESCGCRGLDPKIRNPGCLLRPSSNLKAKQPPRPRPKLSGTSHTLELCDACGFVAHEKQSCGVLPSPILSTMFSQSSCISMSPQAQGFSVPCCSVINRKSLPALVWLSCSQMAKRLRGKETGSRQEAHQVSTLFHSLGFTECSTVTMNQANSHWRCAISYADFFLDKNHCCQLINLVWALGMELLLLCPGLKRLQMNWLGEGNLAFVFVLLFFGVEGRRPQEVRKGLMNNKGKIAVLTALRCRCWSTFLSLCKESGNIKTIWTGNTLFSFPKASGKYTVWALSQVSSKHPMEWI